MPKILFPLVACAALFAASLPAAAGEQKGGCDSFLWPLAVEMAWMTAPDSTEVASGDTLPAPPADKAISLALVPDSEIVYAATPTSTPKPGDSERFGGIVHVEQSLAPGLYQIAISGSGWLDVVQNGAALETISHTGSPHCGTLRKSVRFEIGAAPFTIQISGAPNPTMRIAVRPAAD